MNTCSKVETPQIIGTNAGDYLSNYIDGATIDGGKRNDFIENGTTNLTVGNNVSIKGGTGHDTIKNYGNNVTIDGGKGNNFIYNGYGGSNVLFKYSGGNDLITGFNSTSKLQLSSGMLSSVTSNGSDYFVSVGKNIIRLNDVAYLDKVNIVDSKGKVIKFKVKDITRSNKKNKVKITCKDERDKIVNTGTKVTIIGGNGDDTVNSSGSNVSIFGGIGNDSVRNTSAKVTIDGGEGDDELFSGGAAYDTINLDGSTLIVGGKGNDSIYNGWTGVMTSRYYGRKNSTLDGGDGNDYIRNGGHYYGDGSGENVIINGGAGNDTIYNSGSNVTINGGAGDDSIDNVDLNVTICGGTGNDSIRNWGTEVTIDGDSGNDYISNCSENALINGGSGNDTLQGESNYNDTFFGGAGNDSLNGYSGNDYLDGGSGKDTIYGGYGSDILWGGADNDKLYGDAGDDIFIYKPGEGTDHIADYENGDMLKILKTNGKEGGSFTKATFKNNNLTLAISGGGSVIFDNVSAGDTFNINGKIYTLRGSKFK